LAVLLLSAPAIAKDLSIVGQEYPPFNWTEGGEIKGGMFEVMKAACEKLRYNCKFSLVPLPRAMEMLEEGHADGVMSLVPTPDRARFANFSPTIVTSSLSYLGAKGKVKKVDNLSGLDGWTFGTVRGSASFKMAVEHQKQVKGMNLIEENSNSTVVKKLQGGRYGDKGAIVGGDAVLSYEARKINLELEQILVGQVQSFVTAFSRKSVDEPTLAELTRVLNGMKKSGEMKGILEKFSLQTD
jgi:polar amino acid transport system substrate-binding protein